MLTSTTKIVGTSVVLVAMVATGAAALFINARHTITRAESTLTKLEEFDEKQGAFAKLQQLQEGCGPACFVTTKECDPNHCALEFGFDNRWLSALQLAPSVTLRGFVTVVSDRLSGFRVEYAVHSRKRQQPQFAIVSVIGQKTNMTITRPRWDVNAGWAGGIARAVWLDSSAPAKDKERALGFNLSCFGIIGSCAKLAELAPSASQEGVKPSVR